MSEPIYFDGESSPTPAPAGLTPTNPEHGSEAAIREFLDLIVRRRWMILGVFILMLGIGTAYTLTRKKIYEASAKLVVVTKGSGSSADAGFLTPLLAVTQGRNVGTQVEILSSNDLLTEAYQTLSDEDRKKGFQNATSIPQWGYRIENKPDTDVISITINSYSAWVSAKLANAIARTYLEGDLRRNNQATRQARQYVERELGRSKTNLAHASERLAQFKRSTGLIAPSAQLEQATTRYFQLRANAEAARAQHQASQRRMASLESELRDSGDQVLFGTTVQQNPLFASSLQNIATLQGKRAELIQEYAPGSPEVTQIDEQIRLAQAELRRTSSTIVAQTVRQRNPVRDALAGNYANELANEGFNAVQQKAAEDALAAAKKEMEKYPSQERDLAERSQEVDVLKHTYDLLSERYYSLLISEQSNLPNGMIASRARAPQNPSYPKVVPTLLMLTIASVLVSLGVAVVTERLDTRVRDVGAVERLSGLTVLSGVPDVAATPTQRPLIGSTETNSHAFVESYRILRNNIFFSAPGKRLKTIAVTSAGRGEGKSTTSINLAIAMAMDGKKVLLLDGDLRRPSVHVTLGVSRERGFTTVVAGQCSLKEAVVSTEYENVDVLPSGPLPPNPTEFLNTPRSRSVLQEAADMYEVVIIDSPPCTGLSDMQVISTVADGVILVVALNLTQRPHLQATIQTLRQAGAAMLGVVLNRVELNRAGYGYYYSYYYYYAYEEGDDSDNGRGKKKKKAESRK